MYGQAFTPKKNSLICDNGNKKSGKENRRDEEGVTGGFPLDDIRRIFIKKVKDFEHRANLKAEEKERTENAG